MEWVRHACCCESTCMMRWLRRFWPEKRPGGEEGRPATQSSMRPLKASVSKLCGLPALMGMQAEGPSAGTKVSGPSDGRSSWMCAAMHGQS